jgi:hypothetical protein
MSIHFFADVVQSGVHVGECPTEAHDASANVEIELSVGELGGGSAEQNGRVRTCGDVRCNHRLHRSDVVVVCRLSKVIWTG